jgi:hypothetical protein
MVEWKSRSLTYTYARFQPFLRTINKHESIAVRVEQAAHFSNQEKRKEKKDADNRNYKRK